MARARNIKPGFFTNDILGELEPLARILFAGLWCHADRAGRLEDRPKKLKAEILPYDECDINGLIQCLHSAGMVLRYVVDGKNYIQIVKFDKHQNPHIKEAPSSIPAPDSNGARQVIPETSRADSLNLIPDSIKPSKEKRSPTGSRLPVEQLPEDWLAYCKAERPDLEAHRVFEDFRDYWIAIPGAKGRKLNWLATWQKWVRNTQARTAPKNGSPAWWASDASIEAKGRELGMAPKPGETWQGFKGRIEQKLALWP